jgi:uncharacterized protein (TIGR03067 family)
MKIQLMAVLTIVLLIAPERAKAEDNKAEMKKLEGTWTGVSAIFDGKEIPADEAKTFALTMNADGTWIMKDSKDTWHGTFTVDASKKPKTGSFVILSGKYKDNTTLDIYEIDGDTIKFCYVMVPTGNESAKERPSKFASEAGSGHFLSIMKRDKAK